MVAVGFGAVCACGTSPGATDGGPSDAATERRVPPPLDDGGSAVTGPLHLADTGLYSDFASRTLAPGLIAFAPRYPFWSDGSGKKRWLYLPPNTQIDTTSMDDWVFPVGTKVWKEFTFSGKVVETRLLWKVNAEQWWEVAYAWNADGTDAVAAPDGVPDALGTGHEIPNQTDCNECHKEVSDVLIGVSALQLGASDGDGTMTKLASMGAFTTPPAAAYDVPGTGVTKDALGYLHANCGNCHSARSSLKTQSLMRLNVSVTETTPEQTGVYKTTPFLVMRHTMPQGMIYALVPGQPDQSGLLIRMALRDSWAMPPEGTQKVDPTGLGTVGDWIASLPCGAACTSAPAP